MTHHLSAWRMHAYTRPKALLQGFLNSYETNDMSEVLPLLPYKKEIKFAQLKRLKVKINPRGSFSGTFSFSFLALYNVKGGCLLCGHLTCVCVRRSPNHLLLKSSVCERQPVRRKVA